MRLWTRRTTVSSPSGSSETSTRVDWGGVENIEFSQPQVKTTRRGGSTSTYSPDVATIPLGLTRHTPPGRGSSVASVPIHMHIRSGSVKYGKIVSGLAATRTVCSMTSVPLGSTGMAAGALLLLGEFLEPLQPRREHVGQETVQVVEALGADAEQAARAVAALVDQPGLLEHLQVLRDGRLGHRAAPRYAAGAHHPA